MQDEYVDDNGQKVKADVIQNITTYYYIVDGFYEWYCGHCHEVYNTRSCGWPIAGQVLTCQKCGQNNLLLRNDVDFVNKGAAFAVEYEGATSVIEEYKKRAEKAEKYESELRSKLMWLLQVLQGNTVNWLTEEFEKIRKDAEKHAFPS